MGTTSRTRYVGRAYKYQYYRYARAVPDRESMASTSNCWTANTHPSGRMLRATAWTLSSLLAVGASAAMTPQLFMDPASDPQDPWGLLQGNPTALTVRCARKNSEEKRSTVAPLSSPLHGAGGKARGCSARARVRGCSALLASRRFTPRPPRARSCRQADANLTRPPANYSAGDTVFGAFTSLDQAGAFEVFVAVGRPGEPLLGAPRVDGHLP